MRYVFADCELDTQLCAVHRSETWHALRPKPLHVLLYLIEHCDRVVSKEELAEQLWPNQYVSDAVIENSILARAYHTACAAVIERFEGHIAQYLGDGLLVYFGYPQAHEDDAQRAVHTALGILETLGQLNGRLQATHGIQVAVRIGIHTGLVVVSAIGTGAHAEPLALGETPNIAARLQDLAAANTVVLCAATYQLVHGYFACQALGAQSLPGLAEPLDMYHVLQTSGVPSRFAVAMTRGLTPLVDRERERDLLLDRWTQARDGSGQVVLISGEAGIGKSRLVQALRDCITPEPHTQWEWQSSPYHQHTAFWPVIELLQRLFQWQEGDTATARLQKLEENLTQKQLALHETVPLLASLLALSLAADRYPILSLTPEQQRQQTFATLLTLVQGLAAQQPVLLIVEDLHWVDPSTRELLELLIDQGPTAALLTVVMCRPTLQPSWVMREHVTHLTLGRLTPDSVDEMIRKVAGGELFPEAVRQQIVATTDGVPLSIEEVTKMVVEASGHRASETRPARPKTTPTMTIPATLHDLLMARLDQVGPSKAVAQVGAVVGRTFAHTLLQAVAVCDEATLQMGLRQLVSAELLYQQGVPPQATYTFKHVLIQEAAYNSLLTRRRKELHRAVGDVIEALYSDRLAEYHEALAYHFRQGEVWPKVMAYSLLAGDHAADAFANAEAKAHYTYALQAAQQMIPPPDLERVARLQTKHAAVLELLGEHEEAVAAYQRALELIRLVGDRRGEIDILVGLSGVYNSAHREESAKIYSEDALALARDLDDRARLAVCLVQRAAIRSVAYGQIVEATPDAEEALFLTREIGEPKSLAQSLLFLGELLQFRAEFDRALVYLNEGVELARQAHAGRLIGHAAFFLGNAYTALGAYEEALQWYQQLSDYASASGDTFWLARLPNTIGGIHLELFDIDEALRLHLEGDEVAQRYSSWPEPRGHSLVKAGLAYLQQGEHGHATACFRRAEALLETDAWMRWRWHMVLLRAYGELALAEGRHDEAWSYATQSLQLAAQSDSRKHVARAQWLQGNVLMVQGRLEDAVQTLQASARLAEQIRTPREVWLVKATLGQVLMRLGREQEAEVYLTQAAETIAAIAAHLRTPRLRYGFLSATPVLDVYATLGHRPPPATL